MSRTLVVCDNEFLKTLYVLNLEVYLATDVAIVDSIESAIEFHRKDKKIDLILSLDRIKKIDATLVLEEYKKSYGVKTPIVYVGDTEKELGKNSFMISSRYNIQGILKKAASILGVTAKQMSELQLSPYYPISSKSISFLTKAPCDIYHEKFANFSLVSKAGEVLKTEILQNTDNVFEKYYVRSSDRLVIVNAVSFKLIEQITEALKNIDDAPIEKKVELLSDSFEIIAANLFSTEEVRQEVAEIANAASRVMSDVIKENANLKNLLSTMLSNQSGYIFTHSMITSYVANHIIKNVTWGGDNQSDKINFILFFHDIYLAPLYLKHPTLKYEKDILTSSLLSDKEKDLVMNHAKLSAEMVVSYKRCPMGADVLIKHHHGMKKGMGFANRYAEDLSLLTKVLLIAESFVEHFVELNEKKEKVEMKLIIPKLVDQFQTQSYTKIVQTLVNLPL